ncbi:phosphoribosylanthranilate isomerase [Winogradskyella wandonensis]|uniref:N-(5'-phosphoribosyl)anthranilate isomerase n=1 Tax=Winogradskyella wandonensis TaxID=1442586 RepID=A0A4R1KPA6_9FLAO|nr:phosphoribosylanthranilate isomerase [Winogradskyella wandonensis]TCK66876.1 phosphoribosylanthranilate isomerase [Winogradskyella wandonensis]
MKLKICGMKYQENIKAVAALHPDYLGFIFYDKSSRFFDGKIPQLPNSIKKVGVFVNESLDKVINLVEKHNLQAVQLHGNESPEYCTKLKTFCHAELDSASHQKIELIKVFSIKNSFNFDILKPYEGIVDYFLFDTKGKLPGGNGYTFNWDVLKNYPSTTPYFLSGGIGLNEVEKIKAFKKSPASKYCYAVDVNSKFELEPGLKNINELEKFKYELQH